MKHLFLIILLSFTGCNSLLVSGCASVTYEAPDGAKVTYSRCGNQKIDGLIIESEAFSVLMENQEADIAESLKQLRLLVEGIK